MTAPIPERRAWFTAPLLLALLATHAGAAETVAQFRGSDSRHTADFEVRAPWILDWRVTTEGHAQAAVDVSLEAAGTGVHQGSVLKTKYPGNGVRLFSEDGEYYFRVKSLFAGWTLTVIELTDAEAAEYQPREASPLRDF